MSLEAIAAMLGHRSLDMTLRYATVGQDARNRMLRSALARAFEGEDGR